MTPAKRTRISLADRYSVVKDINRGVKSSEIQKRLNVSAALISSIKKNKESIIRDFEAGLRNATTKSNLSCKYPEVDAMLLTWFKQATTQNLEGLSGMVLQQQAIKLAKLANLPNFDESKIDINWINRFKQRHSIGSKKQHGEAGAVSARDELMWKEERLPEIQRNFQRKDIFNADECGLFWKVMPDRTLSFKKDKCSGGKKSKERITVVVGASAMGEKLPLWIIGKAKMPRAFRGKNLPVTYRHNRRAWMTGILWEEYVRELDCQMRKANRKIALIVDNCPAHPNIENLTNMTIYFLPPNTTARTQPMDAGVIRNLKFHYKVKLVNKRIDAFDLQREFEVDLYESVLMLHNAWTNDVTTTTISNCFRHTGFTPDTADASASSDAPASSDDLRISDNIFDRLQALFGTVPTFDEYVDVDADIHTCEEVTDQQIVNDQLAKDNDAAMIDEDSSDDEQPSQHAVPTTREALNALNIVQRYLCEMNDGASFIQHASKIEHFITAKGLSQLRQQTIDRYFT